ncbi:hypothetical protein [Brochothrix phage ADU4]|nr:hypothetical protein [Brochothrix phage ADU4]
MFILIVYHLLFLVSTTIFFFSFSARSTPSCLMMPSTSLLGNSRSPP